MAEQQQETPRELTPFEREIDACSAFNFAEVLKPAPITHSMSARSLTGGGS